MGFSKKKSKTNVSVKIGLKKIKTKNGFLKIKWEDAGEKIKYDIIKRNYEKNVWSFVSKNSKKPVFLEKLPISDDLCSYKIRTVKGRSTKGQWSYTVTVKKDGVKISGNLSEDKTNEELSSLYNVIFSGLEYENGNVKINWNHLGDGFVYEIIKHDPYNNAWKFLSRDCTDPFFVDYYPYSRRNNQYRIRAINDVVKGPWSIVVEAEQIEITGLLNEKKDRKEIISKIEDYIVETSNRSDLKRPRVKYVQELPVFIFNSVKKIYKPVLFSVILMAVLAIIIFAVYKNTVEVNAIIVKKADHYDCIEETGIVAYKEKAVICSRVEGKMEDVFFEKGDSVERGQVLAKIEPAQVDYQIKKEFNDLKIASLQLSAAKEKLKKAELNVEIQLKNIEKAEIKVHEMYLNFKAQEAYYDKMLALNKAGGLSDLKLEEIKNKCEASKKDYNDSKKDLEMQKFEINDDEVEKYKKKFPFTKLSNSEILKKLNTRLEQEEVKAAESYVEKLKNSLAIYGDYKNVSILKAPINGCINEISVKQGDAIKKDAEIMTIIDISDVYVDVPVEEDKAMSVQEGMGAEIVPVDDKKGHKLTGEVLLLEPTVDPMTRRMVVKLLVKNDKETLFPGMKCNASIIKRVIPGAYFIPYKAVIEKTKGNKAFIYKVEKNRAVYREIAFEEKVEKGYIISKGLAEGDVVIVSNADSVKNGKKVRIKNLLPQ